MSVLVYNGSIFYSENGKIVIDAAVLDAVGKRVDRSDKVGKLRDRDTGIVMIPRSRLSKVKNINLARFKQLCIEALKRDPSHQNASCEKYIFFPTPGKENEYEEFVDVVNDLMNQSVEPTNVPDPPGPL
eukprot:CAMPEP_0170173444 /NCGR_PEP_ID=MMETSP0040_2-20121228/6741_1 /TAXON_ID=641309 /ORGANISM="Lotharella oceanica, Strain CCMP622" /LENGTH=128 /DNA_ID=CAMNT_0010414633 /DNA_START=191 /DNA_END=577 /DNA_ORIENTATION=-